jgi:hypothetical protein
MKKSVFQFFCACGKLIGLLAVIGEFLYTMFRIAIL